MPLYEYLCETCGRFELIRKFSDEPLQSCPTCGKPVEKLLSSPAIQFKGTGWYVTDYAGKTGTGKPGSAKKDAPQESGGSTSSDAGSAKTSDSSTTSSSGSSGSGSSDKKS
jgi:putative FmdB family regulatory protein